MTVTEPEAHANHAEIHLAGDPLSPSNVMRWLEDKDHQEAFLSLRKTYARLDSVKHMAAPNTNLVIE